MKLITEAEFQTNITEFKNVDVSLEQWFDALKSHLVAMTWSASAIDQYITEWAQEMESDE